MNAHTIRAIALMQTAAQQQRAYGEAMDRISGMKATLDLTAEQVGALDIAYFCLASAAGQAMAQKTYWETRAAFARRETEPVQ